ncbi:MAG TPA: addiction module protein [Pyrinomonadaceae bacterium]|nr:addiction module protein [Pyrinomonadaceae bacterium]
MVSTVDDEIEIETEAMWFAEAERRLDELRSGEVQGISLMAPFELRARRSRHKSNLHRTLTIMARFNH